MTELGHVLVVDDDHAILEVITAVLCDEGFTVSTAENGEAAMQQVHQQVPDVVLLDVQMPVMDGWDFRARLRDAEPDIPVVFMSAAFRARFAAMSQQADGYLAKPFTLDELINIVRRFTPNCAG